MPEFQYVCRECLQPIETVRTGPRSWEWRCATHGVVGVMLDGGSLDLGIVRDEAAGDSPLLFIEEHEA